ncbi:endonuclease/exonuclease/phosphatase family protein [Kaarinaea lacus]
MDLIRASFAVFFLLLGSCATSPVKQPAANEVPAEDSVAINHTLKPLVGPLTVLTLNIAHGRKDALNQLMVSEKTIRRNLNETANVIKQSNANIVALQEADGPSRWSGGFDHVAELAQLAGYSWYCRVGQARSWMFDYGTALLSRGFFTQTIAHSFAPTPPTTTKGFLLGQVAWQPKEDVPTTILVDVISVHLDFSRSKVREQQVAEIVEVLGQRKNPIIVLGDFNSEWLADESVVRELANRSGLHTYQPLAADLGTYKSGKRRFDWILISKELEFKHYEVRPDVVSDHFAVVAEIRLSTSADINAFAIDPTSINSGSCEEGGAICNTCN